MARQEELTLSGRRCARALIPLPPTPLSSAPLLLSAPQPPAPLLPPAPLPLQQAPALACLLCTHLMLVMLRVSPLYPLPRGDIILGLGPLHQCLRIPGQPGGPHQPRGPGLQAHGSHLLRDPGNHPLHLIRVLLEP